MYCASAPLFWQPKRDLRLDYIGNVLMVILLATSTCGSHYLLALTTLGDATEIGSFLFMSRCPRWPRQVQVCHCRLSLSPTLLRQLCQHISSILPNLDVYAFFRPGDLLEDTSTILNPVSAGLPNGFVIAQGQCTLATLTPQWCSAFPEKLSSIEGYTSKEYKIFDCFLIQANMHQIFFLNLRISNLH